MNRILVVTYSYTGTGRRLAQALCAQQQWPMAEVLDLRPRRGSWGNWRCVIDSLLRRRPPIRYDGPPPGRFGAVVLIAPVWMRRLAGPMRSFIATHRVLLPDVALVTVMGSSGAPAAAAEVARILGRPPVLATAFTTREVDDGSYAGRLAAFGSAVKTSIEPSPPLRPSFLSPQSA
jgi:hypothetical protein